MIIPLIALLLRAAIAVAFLLSMRSQLRRQESKKAAVAGMPGTQTLIYEVPPGQDPLVVLSALERAGFTAVSDVNSGPPKVVISCPEDRDRVRAEVRTIIEGADTTSIEHGAPVDTRKVRFEDEHDDH